MSGIEIVGLIMGAFPIVVENIQLYRKMANQLMKHQVIMAEFDRRITMECVKFENICELLIEGSPLSERIDMIVGQSQGSTEAIDRVSQEFRQLVQERLNPKQAGVFLAGITQLSQCLDELQVGLELNEKKPVRKISCIQPYIGMTNLQALNFVTMDDL